ncbi:MAG: DUF1963 domain-containing protein, partial [Planctomycetota bacterium]
MNLEEFDLQQHAAAIRSVAQPCKLGSASQGATTDNYFGGLPIVEESFIWPTNKERPLSFVGQICCDEIEELPLDKGRLLFFYDNRGAGYSPKDRGHITVMYQVGGREINQARIPTFEDRRLFGLLK